jgi:hypothetical protein
VGACGGDDDAPASPSSPPTTGAADSPSATAAALTSAALLPDLAGLGFVRTQPEKVAAPGGIDISFSIYEKATEPKLQARAEVRVYATEGAAKTDYPIQTEGWKSPPPGVFGIDPKNVSAPALAGMDAAVAYIGSATDQDRNRVFTDVYRVGRVVVVQHVLGQKEADTDPVRKTMADAIKRKVQ